MLWLRYWRHTEQVFDILSLMYNSIGTLVQYLYGPPYRYPLKL